jgi:hypothetical protein
VQSRLRDPYLSPELKRAGEKGHRPRQGVDDKSAGRRAHRRSLDQPEQPGNFQAAQVKGVPPEQKAGE